MNLLDCNKRVPDQHASRIASQYGNRAKNRQRRGKKIPPICRNVERVLRVRGRPSCRFVQARMSTPKRLQWSPPQNLPQPHGRADFTDSSRGWRDMVLNNLRIPATAGTESSRIEGVPSPVVARLGHFPGARAALQAGLGFRPPLNCSCFPEKPRGLDIGHSAGETTRVRIARLDCGGSADGQKMPDRAYDVCRPLQRQRWPKTSPNEEKTKNWASHKIHGMAAGTDQRRPCRKHGQHNLYIR